MEPTITDNHDIMQAVTEHLPVVYHWQQEVFQGTEFYLFGSLLGTLVIKRQQSPADIGRAMPRHMDQLPLEGAEFALMETLCEAFRERGQSDAAIAAAAKSTAAFMATLVETIMPSTSALLEGAEPSSLDEAKKSMLDLLEAARKRHQQSGSPSARLVTPPRIVLANRTEPQ